MYNQNFILEGLQNGWNFNRFGDLLTSWFGESAASAVFGVSIGKFQKIDAQVEKDVINRLGHRQYQ